MKRQADFQLYGIFGVPLSHTLSPAMQEAAFSATGFKAYYLTLELGPAPFRKVLRALGHLLLDGFNVTVPYKEAVLPYLDRLTPEARRIGAVNTVFRRRRKWVGANTDPQGFTNALEKKFRFYPTGKKVIVLGAGGSARAAVFALAKKNAAEIKIANRHEARAQKIVRDFKPLFQRTNFKTLGFRSPDLKKGLAEADLVVNATSLGLRAEDPAVIPPSWIPKVRRGHRPLFFDFVYGPSQTAFLKNAQARGHRAEGGLEMLLR